MTMPRFTRLLVCGLALAAATLAAGDASADMGTLMQPSSGDPDVATDASAVDRIPEVLTSYPGGIFSTLLAAVTAADLAAALDGNGPFTVFAGPDQALHQLPSQLPSCS